MKQQLIMAAAALLLGAAAVNAESGKATFYTSGRMADGSRYGSHGPIFCAAGRHVPLGTIYRVHGKKSHVTMQVTVRDHGPWNGGHLDMSTSAFRRLTHGKMGQGVEPITYTKIGSKHGKSRRRRP